MNRCKNGKEGGKVESIEGGGRGKTVSAVRCLRKDSHDVRHVMSLLFITTHRAMDSQSQ